MSGTPGHLEVTSLTRAKKIKRNFQFVLTLEDPGVRPGHQLRFHAKPAPQHLILKFEDVDTQDLGYRVVTAEQVSRVLEFGRQASQGSLLVHCYQGVGRSAASALAILADRLGPGNEAEAVRRLFALRPPATPNLVLVGLADTLLGRNGALSGALRAHEDLHPHMARERADRLDFATKNSHLYAKNSG